VLLRRQAQLLSRRRESGNRTALRLGPEMSPRAHVRDLEVLADSCLVRLLKPVETPADLRGAVLPGRVHDLPGAKRFEAHAVVSVRRRHLSGFSQPLAVAAQRPRELQGETGLAHDAVAGEHRNAVGRQPVLDQPLLPVTDGYADKNSFMNVAHQGISGCSHLRDCPHISAET